MKNIPSYLEATASVDHPRRNDQFALSTSIPTALASCEQAQASRLADFIGNGESATAPPPCCCEGEDSD